MMEELRPPAAGEPKDSHGAQHIGRTMAVIVPQVVDQRATVNHRVDSLAVIPIVLLGQPESLPSQITRDTDDPREVVTRVESVVLEVLAKPDERPYLPVRADQAIDDSVRFLQQLLQQVRAHE